METMRTTHRIFFSNSEKMDKIPSNSISLVLTSPPYPMIEMWDEIFCKDKKVKDAFLTYDGRRTFEIMHEKLDKVWNEVSRVLIPGGLACINIGDATRKFGGSFRLYSNHTKIVSKFESLNFQMLPSIIWRKSTTKPNKFMGSGMEPPNAYVTLEHEYVLIFRKGGLRKFIDKEKENRRKSVYFWEERNRWFSDVWIDLRGASQDFDVDKRDNKEMRSRSAAFPFEFAYRLINMFSLIGDTVLDPFCGTGTTMQAAAVSGRNSIGYEIEVNFKDLMIKKIEKSKEISKDVVNRRIKEHLLFMEKRKRDRKVGKKYFSKRYGFEVVTAQEIDIEFPIVDRIERIGDCEFEIEYTF